MLYFQLNSLFYMPCVDVFCAARHKLTHVVLFSSQTFHFEGHYFRSLYNREYFTLPSAHRLYRLRSNLNPLAATRDILDHAEEHKSLRLLASHPVKDLVWSLV